MLPPSGEIITKAFRLLDGCPGEEPVFNGGWLVAATSKVVEERLDPPELGEPPVVDTTKKIGRRCDLTLSAWAWYWLLQRSFFGGKVFSLVPGRLAANGRSAKASRSRVGCPHRFCPGL